MLQYWVACNIKYAQIVFANFSYHVLNSCEKTSSSGGLCYLRAFFCDVLRLVGFFLPLISWACCVGSLRFIYCFCIVEERIAVY
jgi:hypothetical protein